MPPITLHPRIDEYLTALHLADRHETARTCREDLTAFQQWIDPQRLDLLALTTEDLRRYQRYLVEEYRTRNGAALSRTTQSKRISVIKAFYRWLEKRGVIVVDISRAIIPVHVPKRVVTKDYLTMQEVTALLQTQAEHVNACASGGKAWARALRDLAFLCLGIASGRRRGGMLGLKVSDLDATRNEVRCEREKGATGRVLPLAPWAMAVVQTFIRRARPLLCEDPANPFVFPGRGMRALCKQTTGEIVVGAHRLTVERNPDLVELAGKRVSTHSLRVSFATLLFTNGCPIRIVNELMMHEELSTTARYTPIPLADLRRVCRSAHPRA
jgi:integrase/recombinase XerD